MNESLAKAECLSHEENGIESDKLQLVKQAIEGGFFHGNSWVLFLSGFLRRHLGRNDVNTRLRSLNDWPKLAQESGWSVNGLAKTFGISVRSLERNFILQHGQSPKIWLQKQRQREAEKLLRTNDLSVKEVAIQLGYKHITHFCRDFKKFWGFCPTEFAVKYPKT